MLVASDLDGMISANPIEMQGLLSALRAAGHSVVIITGHSGDTVTQDDWNNKLNYLNKLGCQECFDTLVVIANPPGSDLAAAKANWLSDNACSIFFDNAVANVKSASAAGVPLCLVNWANKVKS
jgi:hypothetical protein